MPKSKDNTIRQPVVAVMGHVDHGKTSFLDAVRGTKVADKEQGGITQNTRAHEVTTKSGFKITFIDTPGHEAFKGMRERGARVTDFVFLVVAADDGVQPQTKESIKFAQDNNVPIIVGINKIDISGVKTQKIKTELSNYGVVVEEYGGDVLCFEMSATKRTGLEEVLEGIELLAELQALKPRKITEGVEAEGFVMESTLDKNVGYSALCILKSGNLKDRLFGATKDSIFKVRAYLNEEGKQIKEVNEAQPFTVIGLEKDLRTGEIINFVKTEKEAKVIQTQLKAGVMVEAKEEPMDVEAMFTQMLLNKEEKKQGLDKKELNVIIKASTQGTLEAVMDKLNGLENDTAKVKVLSSATGLVTEDDLNFAKISRAIVISFQSIVPKKIETLAKKNKVLVREYQIIYKMVEEIEEVLNSMDQPQEEEVELATAKVKQVFTLSNGNQVAGCEVTKGTFVKGYRIYVERDLNNDQVEEIGRAKVTSVRQGKNEVKEVKKGSECGLLLEPTIDGIQEGDVIVAFRVEKY